MRLALLAYHLGVEDTVVVGMIAVQVHSALGTVDHIAVVDIALQYPVDPAGSKSQQHRHAEAERRTFCLSI